MRRRNKPPCPVCETKEVVPSVYGHPFPEDVEKAEEGRIVLGGFCIHEEVLTGPVPTACTRGGDHALHDAALVNLLLHQVG